MSEHSTFGTVGRCTEVPVGQMTVEQMKAEFGSFGTLEEL